MGFLTMSLAAAVLLVAFNQVQAGGECPEVSQVYSCSPKCVQNYECTNGKVCCPNQCHLKSCVEPSKYGGSSGNKYQSSGGGGGGIYCNNVKCNSFEVCKVDRATNRMKCQRP